MKRIIRIRATTACTAIGGVLLLSSCSPDLNWRQVSPVEAQGLVAQFPCKPEQTERQFHPQPDSKPKVMRALSCRAGGALWSVRWVTLEDIRQLRPLLSAWHRDFAERTGYQASKTFQVTVPGMTPDEEINGLMIRSDGSAQLQPGTPQFGASWRFSHGMTAFQVSVWRDMPIEWPPNSEDVVSTFQNGFHFPN